MDIAPDGTMVARTDTYGAYIWNGTSWTQIVTTGSMPGGVFTYGGVYEIRVAPSNSNIFYMELADGIYKSVDKGQNWVKTSFVGTFDANGGNRMDGEKMAIDPTNPNVVFAGTQHDGLWVTRDGGSTWQKVTAVPQGTNTGDTGLTGIVIKGSTVYVGTAGSGVYKSSDGGQSWSAIGGPTDISHAAIAPDGSYYATGNTDTALWKYSNGSWTKLIASGVHSVVVDPFNPNHIVAVSDAGGIQDSSDAGATWSGWNWATTQNSSNDVAWLDKSGGYMSSGGVAFDPLHPGQLWQSSGVGVWSMQVPSQLQWNTPLVWNSHSEGIEQLVGNEVLAPAGGDAIFASWDRAFFDMPTPDSYPTNYSGGDFSAGWSIDYASTNSQFIVGISDWWGKENSGFSTDGGKTWQKFAGLPTWATSTVGGSIAASSTTNFIWIATGNQPPAYTLDGGKTWTNISLPGVTDYSGLHNAYYLDRTTVTADRVLPNTFYIFDSNSGVYRTSDGGATWTKVFNGQPSDWSYWNAKIEAVPGSAGELFFTSGPQGNDPTKVPGMLPFMHSKDGGATWQQVAGVQAMTFGYGAPKVAGGPATVFIVGTVNGTYGIWASTDDAQTWTQIGEHPMGSLDNIRTIAGDMDQYGRVYVGFGGSGYAYVDFAGTSAPAPSTPTPAPAPAPAPANLAPTQTASIVDAYNDLKGITLASGAVTNDKTPTLHGSLSAALTSDESVAVYRDGQKIGVATVTNGTWTFTDPGAADGSHSYTAQVQSTSGINGFTSAPFSLKIDTVAPTQQSTTTGAVDDVGPVTGTLASGAVTDDSSPLLQGTLSAALGSDESLIVYRDGVRLGAATVIGGTGWTFADSGVPDGQHSYTTRVEDAAGNVGTSSAAFNLQVKTGAPAEKSVIVQAIDDFGPQQGPLSSGATTDDTSPLLKGTLSAALVTGESLVVYRDGVRLGVASVTGTDWSFADKGVAKGAHVYTTQVVDSSGLVGAVSNSFALTVASQKAIKSAIMVGMTTTDVAVGAATTTTKAVSTTTTTNYTTQTFDWSTSLIDTSKLVSSPTTQPNVGYDAKLIAAQPVTTLLTSTSGSDVHVAKTTAGSVDASVDSGLGLLGHGIHHFGVDAWIV